MCAELGQGHSPGAPVLPLRPGMPPGPGDRAVPRSGMAQPWQDPQPSLSPLCCQAPRPTLCLVRARSHLLTAVGTARGGRGVPVCAGTPGTTAAPPLGPSPELLLGCVRGRSRPRARDAQELGARGRPCWANVATSLLGTGLALVPPSPGARLPTGILPGSRGAVLGAGGRTLGTRGCHLPSEPCQGAVPPAVHVSHSSSTGTVPVSIGHHPARPEQGMSRLRAAGDGAPRGAPVPQHAGMPSRSSSTPGPLLTLFLGSSVLGKSRSGWKPQAGQVCAPPRFGVWGWDMGFAHLLLPSHCSSPPLCPHLPLFWGMSPSALPAQAKEMPWSSPWMAPGARPQGPGGGDAPRPGTLGS